MNAGDNSFVTQTPTELFESPPSQTLPRSQAPGAVAPTQNRLGYPGQLEGGSSPPPEGGRPSKHGSPEGLGVFSVGVQKPQSAAGCCATRHQPLRPSPGWTAGVPLIWHELQNPASVAICTLCRRLGDRGTGTAAPHVPWGRRFGAGPLGSPKPRDGWVTRQIGQS